MARKAGAAADVLKQIGGAPAKKAAAAKNERATIELTRPQQTTLREWVEAKSIEEIAEQRRKNAATEIDEFVREYFVNYIWDVGSRPQNPKLQSFNDEGQVDCESLYLFIDKYKIEMPPVPEGSEPEDTLISALVDAGLAEERAEKLVEAEITFAPQVKLRSLNELLEGHYGEGRQWIEATPTEVSAGQKIVAFLTAGDHFDGTVLTDEEKEVAVIRVPQTIVNSGFLDRIKTYAESRDEVEAILSVVVPQSYPKGAKYAVSSTPAEKDTRLAQAAANLVGVPAAAN